MIRASLLTLALFLLAGCSPAKKEVGCADSAKPQATCSCCVACKCSPTCTCSEGK